jgi:hypothetical protein
MALFGDKCTRCGRRTRNTYENAPTCEACAKEIETRLSAASEQTRPCPLDKTTMEKEVVGGSIVIDRCPTCKGIWLDAGELEQIRRSAELGAASEVLRGMSTYPL